MNVPPSSDLRLSLSVSVQAAMSVGWTLVTSSTSLTSIPANINVTAPFMVIPGGTLPAGGTYTFQVVVTLSDGRQSSGQIVLRTPLAPYGGTVTPSVSTAYSLFTPVTFTFSGWQTANLPLQYAILAKIPNLNDSVPLAVSMNSIITCVLPYTPLGYFAFVSDRYVDYISLEPELIFLLVLVR